MDAATGTDRWPSLRVDDWTPTRETLHMWTQIVGKVRMVRTPMVNHWWQVTLYVSPRGLTTGAIPHETGVFDIEFDVIDAVLRIRHSDGRQVSVPLTAKPVAQLYDETMSTLDDLGVATRISASPNEVDPAIRFAEDHQHASYDPDAARLFWRQLLQAHRVMSQFRASFIGKVSPVHFFWGGNGSRVYPVFREAGAQTSRRRTELRRLGDGRGLFARIEQLRLLARRR